MTPKICGYCRNPEHSHVVPANMSTAHTSRRWPAGLAMERVQLEADECQAVLSIWSWMPDNTCFAQAFRRLQRLGTTRATQSVMRRYGRPAHESIVPKLQPFRAA